MHTNQKILTVLLLWMAMMMVILFRRLLLSRYETNFLHIDGEWKRNAETESVSKKTATTSTTTTTTTEKPVTFMPKIVHFAIGFDSAGESTPIQFEFYQYLAIKAAKLYAAPDAIHLHYFYKPVGPWFEKALKYVDKLLKVDQMPNAIFDRKVDHFAHRTDIFRLKTLQQYGGIFLDLDMILLRNLDSLLKHDCVISRQGEGGAHGMSASFLMAKNGSYFLSQWQQAYRGYDPNNWNQLCCIYPRIIIFQYGQYVYALDHFATSWPLFTYDGIKQAYFDRTYDYAGNYATHLWATIAGNVYLRNLTTHKIWRLDTSLFCKLRNLTADEDGADEDAMNSCNMIVRPVKDVFSSKPKGLVGRWEFLNLTSDILPKIPDFSGNGMHGLLSPLNGYDPVNEDAFNDTNLMAFRGGDHVYLPTLPTNLIHRFTLTCWLRFYVTNTEIRFRKNRKAVVLSIESNNLFVNLETIAGKSLFLTVQGVESQSISIEPNKWWQIAISGDVGRFSLFLFDETCRENATLIGSVTSSEFVRPELPIGGIWIGRLAELRLSDQVAFHEELLQTGQAHFDITSSFKLYDVAYDAAKLTSECLPLVII